MAARWQPRRAFTLLELLVVTVIIGTLSAIMVPSLGAARQRARRVACGQVLHGLSIGMKAYLSDNSEKYPLSAEMPSVNIDHEALPLSLKTYVVAPRAFFCPADSIGYVRTSDHQSFGTYFDGETLSFDYNMSLGGRRVEKSFLYGIFRESATYVLQDFDNFHGAKVPLCRNLLYADYHVGTVEDVLAALGGTVPTTLPEH